MGPRAVALLHAPPHVRRNGDAHYRFRQSSDLHYLTGFDEPDVTAVLRSDPDAGASFVLFARPRDPEREVWDGRRAGLEGARETHGADESYPASELRTRLVELLANADDLHYALGVDPAFDAVVLGVIVELRGLERRGLHAPRRIVDPRGVLHELRMRKTEDEVALLRRAAAITAEAHRAAMAAAAPGVTERELEAVIEYTFRRLGGDGPGYGTIVGSGANATILHYIEAADALADGDLVLLDAGCEVGLYTADVSRTFPVSGRFTPAQRAAYEIVLAAQEACIAMTRPGVTIDELHARAVEILTQGMVDLGLLAGPASARIADGGFRRFYMHRTSHWLGLDVHDVGAYLGADRRPRPLEPGMVLTIEPGLYVARDAADAPEALRGVGIRIEDDVLVTGDGGEVLTAATPKRIDDVEQACRG